MSQMQQGEPYIPPFVRRLMPNATEEEIIEAVHHLREYLLALYRMFLEREARGRSTDSAPTDGRVRFEEGGT